MPPLRFSIPAQPNKKNQASLFRRRVAWQGAGRRVHTGSWNARSRHQSPKRAAATAEHPICPSIPLPLRSVSPGSRKPISAFPRSYRPLRRPSLAHTSQASSRRDSAVTSFLSPPWHGDQVPLEPGSVSARPPERIPVLGVPVSPTPIPYTPSPEVPEFPSCVNPLSPHLQSSSRQSGPRSLTIQAPGHPATQLPSG